MKKKENLVLLICAQQRMECSVPYSGRKIIIIHSFLRKHRAERSLYYLPARRTPRGIKGREAPPYKYWPLTDYLDLYPPETPHPFLKAVSDHVRDYPPLRPPPPRSRSRQQAAPKPAGRRVTELIIEATTASTEPKELSRSKRQRQR